MIENPEERLAELAEADDLGAELAGWLAGQPELAAELEAARRARALLQALAAAGVEPPEGFAERLMERIQAGETGALLLDLSLAGFGRALIELLAALFDLIPHLDGARPAQAGGGAP